MKIKLRRAMALALTLVLVLVTCLLGACTQTQVPPDAPGVESTYTVTVKTIGGLALSNVDVFIYADATQEDLVAVSKTDASGVASFTLNDAKTYAVVLKGVPNEYPTEASYAVTGQTTEIVLTAKLVENPDLSTEKFRVNDVMFDFTVTDTEGNSYTLSELLQQKKAVVLNFWFEQCGPCKAEFPFLQQAFNQYSDDIALLALNPIDSAKTVAQYRTAQGLTIPMASVDYEWAIAFDMMYFPTTMVIDRYGNINLMHVGSVDNAHFFERIFAYYGAEEYVQKIGVTSEDFARG